MDTFMSFWMIYAGLMALGAVVALIWAIRESPPALTHENRAAVAQALYEYFTWWASKDNEQ